MEAFELTAWIHTHLVPCLDSLCPSRGSPKGAYGLSYPAMLSELHLSPRQNTSFIHISLSDDGLAGTAAADHMNLVEFFHSLHGLLSL